MKDYVVILGAAVLFLPATALLENNVRRAPPPVLGFEMADQGISTSTASVNTNLTHISFLTEIPVGYRDWRLISVAHEEGNLNDIRAILGNDIAIAAFREGVAFPDGTIIARLGWQHLPLESGNRAFGRQQSFVAGQPTNGVQFMAKDAKKFATTGGWAFGQFSGGKTLNEKAIRTCVACHLRVRMRDSVFTEYAP